MRAFPTFKWLIYSLLGLDIVLYGRHGTRVDQLDTAAWVLLLLLFEWETGGWTLSRSGRQFVRVLRLAALAVAVWACAMYARERAWLDFFNAATWLGVVLVLELQVRAPADWSRFHRVRRGLAVLLYLALAGFLGGWLAKGAGGGGASAWLDAWDAALWLVAFVVIELNVFGWAGASRRAGRL